jgi:hypothetical protein
MNPLLLARLATLGIPAAIGAWEGGSRAAEQGQNPFQVAGASLLGGGLGLGLGYGGEKLGRFAGTKLAETALGKSALAQGTGALMKASGGPVAPLTAAAIAAPLGFLGGNLGGAVAAPLAAGVTGLAGKIAGPTAGAATTIAQQQQQKLADIQNQLDQTQALSKLQQQKNQPISLTDVYTGVGATAREAENLEAGLQRANRVKDFLAYLPLNEQVKKNELDRLMASAQIRQNIATGADMLQSGYRNAQQIGANAATQLGNALGAQYQYS